MRARNWFLIAAASGGAYALLRRRMKSGSIMASLGDMEKGGARDILSRIHQANELEIEAGLMAERKGQSEKVRSFGEKLVQHHRKVDRVLMEFCRKAGLEISSPSTEDQEERRRVLSRFQNASGHDFDRNFMEAIEESHDNHLRKLREFKARAPQALKMVLDKYEPVIEDHHRKARDLRNQIRVQQQPQAQTTGQSQTQTAGASR